MSYPVHVGHTRHVPLADVCIERRLCGRRRVEEAIHARHRRRVPVRDRPVRRGRRGRARHPRRHGIGDVGVRDARQHAGVSASPRRVGRLQRRAPHQVHRARGQGRKCRRVEAGTRVDDTQHVPARDVCVERRRRVERLRAEPHAVRADTRTHTWVRLWCT